MANAECRISFIRSMANGHICNMHKLVCFTLNTFPLRPATNAMLILRFKSKTNIQLTLFLSTLMFNVQACSEFQDPRFKSAYSIMFPFCSFYLLCSRMCLLTVQKCVVVISNAFYKCNLDLLIFSRFASSCCPLGSYPWNRCHFMSVHRSCPEIYIYSISLQQ